MLGCQSWTVGNRQLSAHGIRRAILRRLNGDLLREAGSGSCPEVFEEVEPPGMQNSETLSPVCTSQCVLNTPVRSGQDSLAIVADSEFSRYKDGTRSTGALAFLEGSYGTCRATAAR